MKRIRCGRGLGDAIYLAAVVRHLVARGERITAACDWPDVFRYIDCKVVPFTRGDIQILAHYASRKRFKETKQFQDCCINAGIKGPVEFKLEWKTVNEPLISKLKQVGKPIIYVQLPRAPMGRKDGFGLEILPNGKVLQKVIDRIGDKAYFVMVGAGQPLFKLNGIDLDLTDKTSVPDVIDIGFTANGFLGYCSFMVPLAEAFDKPALVVWARKNLTSRDPYIAQITPSKILLKESCKHIIDDCSDEEIERAADALYRSL